MAKINITVDTETDEITASIDNEMISNVKEVSIFQFDSEEMGFGEDELYVSIYTKEVDKQKGIKKTTIYRNTEVTKAGEMADVEKSSWAGIFLHTFTEKYENAKAAVARYFAERLGK